MRTRLKLFSILSTLLSIAFGYAVCEQAAADDFYKGKQIRIIVGFSPGGGLDAYSRTIARHMGKHLPGNPGVSVDNMPGAGSMIAANHIYNVAKPDGLTIGNFHGGVLMGQLLGRPGVQFTASKFEYVGTPAREVNVCALTKASGITSVEKWMDSKTPVKVGTSGPGTGTYDHPKILQAALGLPIQLVSGYKGTADIRLAAESGEVAGGCWGWPSIKATWSKALSSGDVMVVLQMRSKPYPDFPKIPLAIDLAKTEDARQLIQAGIHDVSEITYTYALPPGTAKEQVRLLRRAFEDTMNDPAFLAEAQKSNLYTDPVRGDEFEKTVARLFTISPGVLSKLKEILVAN
jgi:tripartite-type tricarboxylate transporter receptor subunit TctC